MYTIEFEGVDNSGKHWKYRVEILRGLTDDEYQTFNRIKALHEKIKLLDAVGVRRLIGKRMKIAS